MEQEAWKGSVVMVVIQKEIPKQAIRLAYQTMCAKANIIEDDCQKLPQEVRLIMRSMVDRMRDAAREIEEWYPEVKG